MRQDAAPLARMARGDRPYAGERQLFRANSHEGGHELMRQARHPVDLFDNTGDVLLLIFLTVTAVGCTWSWLTGQLAALFSHGDWPPVSIGQALAAAWRLPAHVRDPRMAWPASVRAELPGPAGFLIAGAASLVIVSVIFFVVGAWALSRSQRGNARPVEIRAALPERPVAGQAHVVWPNLRRRRRRSR
jgi:type IV secretion system protein VirD4